MEDFDAFGSIFGSAPDVAYNQKTIEQIHKHRRSLENELFFDRLLKAIGVDQGELDYRLTASAQSNLNSASKLYPPRSNEDLRTLFHHVVSSSSQDHHKQSLVYYILKDLPQRKGAAEIFVKDYFLPRKYRIFVDGIWLLDRLELEVSSSPLSKPETHAHDEFFQEALDYLTEPCLIPTFPEEVLYTLCRHAPKNDSSLPLAYYHTVSPSLSSTKVLDAFFAALCQASITEAFCFSRSQGEITHQHLFEELIAHVHGASGGEVRAMRGMELINLPLDDNEELWMEQYLTEGNGSKVYGAKDTVMMRKIAVGRGREAVEFANSKNLTGKKLHGVNWTHIRDALR